MAATIPVMNWKASDLNKEWKQFEKQVELLFKGLLKHNTPTEHSSYIKIWITESGREILKSINFPNKEADCPNQLLKQLREYCQSMKSSLYTRFIFQELKQEENETMENFVNRLRKIAESCNYRETEQMIRDRFIRGIKNKDIQKELLNAEDTLTLNTAIAIAKELEKRESRVTEICTQGQEYGKRNFKVCFNNVQQIGIRYVALIFMQIMIMFQSLKGYILKGMQNARYGFKLRFNKIKVENHNKPHDTQDETYIFSVDDDEQQPDTVYATLNIGLTDKIKFKIDTGAQVNVIPAVVYDKLNNPPPLSKARHRLVSYTGQQLTVKGAIHLQCSYKGKTCKSEFIVAEGCQSQPILSLKTSLELSLIQLTLSLENPKMPLTKESVISEYKDVFSGFGGLDGTVSIQIKENAVPVIHAPRRVPYAIKDKVKAELDKMEMMKVIEKVEEPTDWVNSLVIAEKPNGKLRLCLDPKDLNEAIKRPHYTTKTLEEALAEMPNAKYFSKLDAQSGYWQLKLDEKSSYLTTFNTPHGRYKFNRLPFGLVCAQDYFQMKMDEIFEGIPGVTPLVDDVLISGSTIEEHDRTLRNALERAKEKNLKLNPEKLTVGVQQVEYFGHLVTSEGLKPDPAKVNAIINMPSPKDKKELHTILGMITYLAKFAPSLSEITKPMRDILKEDFTFMWDKPQQDAFDKVKLMISNTPVLTFFDPKKELILEVDASKHGLGAAIYNDGKPIAFASKALNATEQNYAQIEKELYAILFGCIRFHQYIYGRKTKVHSDHKPLESIMKKPLCTAPPRLQRMLLQLQKYDITVKHVSGKSIPVSDALSRQHLSTVDNMSEEFEASVNTIMENLPVRDEKMNMIRQKTQEDEQMKQVKNHIRNGWPETKDKCHTLAKEYWNHRDELTIIDDIILKGERILIPKAIREIFLENLHEGHIGVEKSLQRAKTAIFWPGITNDIKDRAAKCPTCIAHLPSQSKETMISHEIPNRPWQKVGTDLFDWNNKQYLITVDYYSRYFELDELHSTTSNAIIKKLCHHFARHGIAETVISDNGPQYSSEEFKQFATKWDFKHVTSSPLYSQSNGLAEKTVQTAKKLLSKAKDEGINFERLLLHYRSTPVDNLASPAQLLMGRQIRSTLPSTESQLSPKLICPEQVMERRKDMQLRQQQYYNQHARQEAPEMKEGQEVYVQLTPGSRWKPGQILKKADTPRSYQVIVDGIRYRRNSKFIKEKRLSSSLQDRNHKIDDSTNVIKTQMFYSSRKTNDGESTYGTRTRLGKTIHKPMKLNL